MKIHKVRISNWRSVKNLEFTANDLMIIIGQNNHGKSNLLSALLFFFGETKCEDQDFHFGTHSLFVEITFTDLDDTDKRTFAKYLTYNETMTVRKSASIGSRSEYRGYIQSPVSCWLQECHAGDLSKHASDIPEELKSFIPVSMRMSKSLIIDAQKKYIEKNKDRIEFQYTLESTQFMGFKNVAKGLFGKVYFIPAIREAGDDVNTKDSSIFGKLYSELISEMTMNNQHMKKIRDDLNQLFRILNRLKSDGVKNTIRPRELISIEQEINTFLAPWGTDLEVEFKNLDIESICKSHTRIWIHDGVRTDIGRKGHGLQRALVIALVKLIAKKQQSTQSGHASVINGKTASKSAFFLIEEPELYLHPQAQRELFDSLTTLTDSGHQVIACTHSSALIDLKYYKSIYIATKEQKSDGTKIKYCHDDICTGKTEKNFFKLAYWMNPDRGELFFAKKVILVEGATEKTVFPFLAKTLGIFSHDISLVECGSKTAMPPYIRLLNHFSIPYVVVYDKDHHTKKGPKAKTSADIASKTIESSINDSIGNSVVLENDIEEELGIREKGGSKPFNALQHLKSDQFVLSGNFKEKIFSIYDLNAPVQCRPYA